jgi:hypothetical protein
VSVDADGDADGDGVEAAGVGESDPDRQPASEPSATALDASSRRRDSGLEGMDAGSGSVDKGAVPAVRPERLHNGEERVVSLTQSERYRATRATDHADGGPRSEMSDTADDPRCPKCGGAIGRTATYCMHCSADLTDERAAADADGDGVWDQAEAATTDPRTPTASGEPSPGVGGTITAYGRTVADAIGNVSSPGAGDSEQLLAPDGLVDNTLTALVGIVGGVVVGVVGTIVLGFVTGSGWAVVFGLVAWLGATAYLVRCRTVQAAVAKSSYGVALVLLLVPVIALSPVSPVDGGIEERGGLFLVLFVFVAVPAGIAATIGWVASRFVPEGGSESEV